MTYNVDKMGYYGEFGGAYIPEMLYPNIENLRQNYLSILSDNQFKNEYNELLKNFTLQSDCLKNIKQKYI